MWWQEQQQWKTNAFHCTLLSGKTPNCESLQLCWGLVPLDCVWEAVALSALLCVTVATSPKCLVPPIQPLNCIMQPHCFLSLFCFALHCRVLGEYTGKKFNTRLLVLANTAGTASSHHPSLSEVFCPEFPWPNKPCRSTQQQCPVYAELC